MKAGSTNSEAAAGKHPEGKPGNDPASPSDENGAQALRRIIHDLNGELFLIRGYADMAIHNLGDQETARRNLQKMLDRSDGVEDLLRRLREFVPQK